MVTAKYEQFANTIMGSTSSVVCVPTRPCSSRTLCDRKDFAAFLSVFMSILLFPSLNEIVISVCKHNPINYIVKFSTRLADSVPGSRAVGRVAGYPLRGQDPTTVVLQEFLTYRNRNNYLNSVRTLQDDRARLD